MSRKVSFHTLGCKLNFSESSTLARHFESGGFVRAESGQTPDICVINSCSVTAEADKKCRNLIRKLHRTNPEAIIVVTGCYAQLKPEEIASIEGVDLVVGNNNKGDIVEKVLQLEHKHGTEIHSCSSDELTNFFAAFSSADRTRAFLKVQDGCDYRCSYCTIPNARGSSRNISISKVINEAGEIAAGGQKEIVITGINTGDFGRTTGEKFIDLLRALDEVEGIERYRISSIEPNLLSDEIIEFSRTSSKFQPHFHIPLQSGSDRILGLMRRRYTTATFASRIEAVRRVIPDAFIGIDVIVGFPGESDEDFQTTYDFIRSVKPSFLHIFPYSERPNTPAIEFADKIPPQTIAKRAAILSQLSDKLHKELANKYIGTTAKVLFESTIKDGKMSGFTENYLRINAPYDRSKVNTIVETIITSDNIVL